MSKMTNLLKEQSISDFLDLTQKIWFIEFESADFGSSLVNILELPLIMYQTNSINHFWSFLSKFLLNCEIAFISKDSKSIDIALIGICNDEPIGIPLWIMDDILLGFEVKSIKNYIILDRLPLKWYPPTIITGSKQNLHKKDATSIILSDGLFQKKKIYLKIENNQIFISEYLTDQEVFERIVNVDIPDSNDSRNG